MSDLGYRGKIKEYAKVNGMTLKQVAEVMGITEVGLHKAFRNNTIRVDHITKFARHIQTPIDEFFSEELDVMTEDIGTKRGDVITNELIIHALTNLMTDQQENTKFTKQIIGRLDKIIKIWEDKLSK